MDSPLVKSLQTMLGNAARNMALNRLQRRTIIFCIWLAALACVASAAGIFISPLPAWAIWTV